MCDKDLKTNGRGSFDFRIDLNSSLRLIKQYDNKAVILESTFSSVQSTSDKQRWGCKEEGPLKDKVPRYGQGLQSKYEQGRRQ